MIAGFLRKYTPPAGPVLSLLLIGLLLLSALLYYRAVRIQRFLEPALAFSNPRNEFTKNINQEFQKQFGENAKGVKIKMSSIQIERSFLFSRDGALVPSARPIIKKLSRVLVALLGDDHTRSDISLVLIVGRFPLNKKADIADERDKAQHMVGHLQDRLMKEAPALGSTYAAMCATATQPAALNEPGREFIEVRIIPSELLHIEMLQKLVKYAR